MDISIIGRMNECMDKMKFDWMNPGICSQIICLCYLRSLVCQLNIRRCTVDIKHLMGKHWVKSNITFQYAALLTRTEFIGKIMLVLLP